MYNMKGAPMKRNFGIDAKKGPTMYNKASAPMLGGVVKALAGGAKKVGNVVKKAKNLLKPSDNEEDEE